MLAHTHDAFCDCTEPIVHTAILCFSEEPSMKFTPPEKDLIKKCITGETTDTENGDLGFDVIGEGDLAALFDGDIGEEEDTG